MPSTTVQHGPTNDDVSARYFGPAAAAAAAAATTTTATTPRPKPLTVLSSGPASYTQQLKVGHQKISIDVDLASNSVEGVTEVTVLPLSNKLKVIKFDCREMKINAIYVNGHRHHNYIYNDLLYMASEGEDEEKDKEKDIEKEREEGKGKDNGSYKLNLFDLYTDKIGIHQSHLIKSKLSYIFRESYSTDDESGTISTGILGDTQELKILLPDNMKFELVDLNSIGTPRGSQPGTVTPSHLKSKATASETYSPIEIKIEYELKNPKNGLIFVTNNDLDKRSWHAYTTNPEYNISTSSWVPCIDNLNSRNTWTLEVSIPRTLKDIGNPRIIGSKEAIQYQKQINERSRKMKISGEEGIDDEDENSDLIACTGDYSNTRETPHPIDLSKKVVSWSIFNSVSAHHIGWAVGCFKSFVLNAATVQEEDEANSLDNNDNNNNNFGANNNGADDHRHHDDDDDTNEKTSMNCPVTIYALEEDLTFARDISAVTSRALEYFSNEFGSFPFSSYSIAFVKHPVQESNSFAGLTLFSADVLYPPDLIEPMFSTTDKVLTALATQWSGVNIVPNTFNDMWCTVGIAGFMAISFLQKLMGTNEYRYRVKKLIERIVEEDVNQRPIGDQFLKFPVSNQDFEFMRLKAPVVFFILDNRMTKTDKSFGMLRVIPKLFLHAMSGELPNGTLSTDHLQHVCEKVNRNKLESFFKQWVFGAGTPSFIITQRFNRKKGMLEMTIRQVQHLEKGDNQHKMMKKETFIDDALCYLNNEPSRPKQNVFTGPMTIRVHESDGTPYEHIIHIKELKTTMDISLAKKVRKIKKKDEGVDPGIGFNQFGDILPTESSTGNSGGGISSSSDFNLQDWDKRDEESLSSLPFEWVRGDVDLEWIAKVDVRQPDFMFASQLVYDRDVEAQYDAVQFFANVEKPSVIYCTSLLRTFLDRRYFYGIRIEAARALAMCSNQGNEFIGAKYLIQAFKFLYCFPGSLIPKSNDFSDIKSFLVQRAVPGILSTVTDHDGRVPSEIQQLLYNLIKFNDNSMNQFSDSLYVNELIKALVTSAISGWRKNSAEGSISSNNTEFADKVMVEVSKLQKLDEWQPSHQRLVQVTCVESKVQMALAGAASSLSLEDLVMLTLDKYPVDGRTASFKGLLLLSGLNSSGILKYFSKVALLSFGRPNLKRKLIGTLIDAIVTIAIHGSYTQESRTRERIPLASGGAQEHSSMVIIEDSSNSGMQQKHDQLARATIKGSIDLIRRDLAQNGALKQTIWELLHSSLLSTYEKRNVFLITAIVFEEVDSLMVKLPIPSLPVAELKKKIVAKQVGETEIVFRREGRFKIQLVSRKPSSAATATRKSVKDEPSASQHKPLIKLSLKSAPADADIGDDSELTQNPETESVRKHTTKPQVHSPPKPSSSSSARSSVKQHTKSFGKVKSEAGSAAQSPTRPPAKAGRRRSMVSLDHSRMKVKLRLPGERLAQLQWRQRSEFVAVYGSSVRIRLPKRMLGQDDARDVHVHRYVRINTRRKTVEISTDPFLASAVESGTQETQESVANGSAKPMAGSPAPKEVQVKKEPQATNANGEQVEHTNEEKVGASEVSTNTDTRAPIKTEQEEEKGGEGEVVAADVSETKSGDGDAEKNEPVSVLQNDSLQNEADSYTFAHSEEPDSKPESFPPTTPKAESDNLPEKSASEPIRSISTSPEGKADNTKRKFSSSEPSNGVRKKPKIYIHFGGKKGK
ncbi:uncharacterized protein LODBEIA_P41250 [Lodderomyces beijingensis]|uniref:Transcription initiation factor TFIID subunit 2 n=1 Tax=Lodderomyces beijingensis TaxID=1775926 RepID=A0ABP0ZSI7_9ASCO